MTKVLFLNPALDGWLLENWFLWSLSSYDGVQCYKLKDDMNAEHVEYVEFVDYVEYVEYVKWDAPNLYTFDPSSNPPNIKNAWNRPIEWNQAGYDAVEWKVTPATEGGQEERHLAFVQVTRSGKHKYKAELFQMLVSNVRWLLPDGDVEQQQLRSETEMKLMSSDAIAKLPKYFIKLMYVVPMSRLDSFKLPTSQKDFKRRLHDEALRRALFEAIASPVSARFQQLIATPQFESSQSVNDVRVQEELKLIIELYSGSVMKVQEENCLEFLVDVVGVAYGENQSTENTPTRRIHRALRAQQHAYDHELNDVHVQSDTRSGTASSIRMASSQSSQPSSSSSSGPPNSQSSQ